MSDLENLYVTCAAVLLGLGALTALIQALSARHWLAAGLMIIPLPLGFFLANLSSDGLAAGIGWAVSVLTAMGFLGWWLMRGGRYRWFAALVAVAAALLVAGLLGPELVRSHGFLPNFGWFMGVWLGCVPALLAMIVGGLIGWRAGPR
ncbi:MAG: hypothetical protein Q4G14_07275 [Paracoccus sp. (in: a-proteobacteria)]|uniref:hypothetical protein n=1 Tax=Paracoccus sp. TaxID=267 RepID=UPI0026E07AC8|nr:hypothetical protein [Paracoccus sp. (in: a-proteobacteria)]MDO5613029.1 hypothetical protein [Paracoccus sp. (in: a-proteobacteria)]